MCEGDWARIKGKGEACNRELGLCEHLSHEKELREVWGHNDQWYHGP